MDINELKYALEVSEWVIEPHPTMDENLRGSLRDVYEAAKAYAELLQSQTHVIVPREPTLDMCDEVKSQIFGNIDAMRLWDKMLSAVPPYKGTNNE